MALLWARRRDEVQTAIEAIESNGSGVVAGVAYGATDLPALYRLEELYRVKAAIQAIEQGGQSYAIGGTTYTRGDLRALYRRQDELTARAGQAKRGGMRVRFGVPLG